MFAEDISWVVRTRHVVEPENAGRNGFSGTVVRECIVPLHEFGMGDRGGVDDRLVVSKHHGFVRNGYPKVSESGA